MLIGIVCTLSLLIALGICFLAGAFLSLTWLWLLPVSLLGSILILSALHVLFLMLLCAFVDLKKPQEKDSPLYRRVVSLTAGAVLPILRMKMEVTGLEKTPKDGRFLLVCNHLNDLDPVVLLHYFRKQQLAFISKWENSSMFIVGKMMHKIQCQLINRENDREALKTILKCIQILKEDKASIAVFPEGYTSRDHKFHEFRPGVFKIAQKAKVPIVVCTVTNTHTVFHNFLHFKPTHLKLHLIDVIQPAQFADLNTTELAQNIHTMMASDLGAEYAPAQNT